MGEDVRLTAADGFELGGYRAKPDGAAKGGVVVIQEIFGVNAHIRSVCDRYAEAGYLAVAPAVYDRIEPDVQLRPALIPMGSVTTMYWASCVPPPAPIPAVHSKSRGCSGVWRASGALTSMPANPDSWSSESTPTPPRSERLPPMPGSGRVTIAASVSSASEDDLIQ